ncbi:CRTAC1 isoform 6, partial [Pan troglodytes]
DEDTLQDPAPLETPMNASSSHSCALETSPYVSTPMEATGAGPTRSAVGATSPTRMAQPVWKEPCYLVSAISLENRMLL